MAQNSIDIFDTGVHSLAMAILTQSTCGEACWEAREDICRCSCGGKNHGVLRTKNGVQPVRTARIDGDMYQLHGVGESSQLYDEASQINKAHGPYRVDHVCEGLTYTYFYHETDKHAPARLKPATASQVKAWPELSAFRDWPQYKRVYLLWVKVEAQK